MFSADFTVLPPITTVSAETSNNCYICEISAQVSQIVFSAHLTVLRIITTVWANLSKKIYLREFFTEVSQIVLWLFWPIYGLLQLYELNLQKSLVSVSSVHKYQKSCFQLNLPFCCLLQL